MRASWLAIPLALLCVAVSLEAQGEPDIVRCREGAAAVCIVVAPPPGATAGRPPLLLRGDTLPWVGATAGTDPTPVTLLVLIDVSGSMKGAGMTNLRPAIRAFLASLDPRRFRVAVAPFESHDVEPRVRGVTFASPAQAAEQLSALPDPRGNTGLYSAVAAAADVASAAAQQVAGSRAVVLVVTDGANDIRAGDDPGLLAGATGLEEAAQRVAASGATVWAIGAGANPQEAELRRLAGPLRAQLAALDPLALGRALSTVGEGLSAPRRLVYSVPDSLWRRAAKGPMATSMVVRPGVGMAVGTWVPPRVALPAVNGAAFPAKDVDRWSLWSRRLRLGMLGVVLVVGGFLLGLWRHTRPEPGARHPVRPRALRRVAASSLRPGVREAAPRGGEEVTADPGQRIVGVESAG